VKYTIGICGIGFFGSRFVPLFKAHPVVKEVVLVDAVRKRAEEAAAEAGIDRVLDSFDELLASDVDAVAIFTQRHLHAPMAVQALKAGKHVYSAVPAAVRLEELRELVETVKETGLTYMLGETSYYRPQTIFCREKFAKGGFGRFVYGEGHYHHDMSHFYQPYMHSGGDEWKRVASFPPMLYPTHSVSHVLSVTFSRMTEVCCMGFDDDHEDGIFDRGLSMWDNPFSNQTGLFRTADGGMARINEFRRTGASESRMNIFGTVGTYEEQMMRQVPAEGRRYAKQLSVFSYLDFLDGYRNADGSINFAASSGNSIRSYEDVSNLLDNHTGVVITEENLGDLPREYLGRVHEGVAPIHPVERLPAEFVGMENGHNGSHQFLVQDFLESLETGTLPPNNVWMAARYNAPGIVAHQSSMKGGELMKIPDYGMPPAGVKYLDPLSVMK
jgi:predicted dehydrogenase